MTAFDIVGDAIEIWSPHERTFALKTLRCSKVNEFATVICSNGNTMTV